MSIFFPLCDPLLPFFWVFLVLPCRPLPQLLIRYPPTACKFTWYSNCLESHQKAVCFVYVCVCVRTVNEFAYFLLLALDS